MVTQGHTLLTKICPPNEFLMEKVTFLSFQTAYLCMMSSLPLL